MTEIIWYNLRSAEQQLRKETRENGVSDATYNEQIGIIKSQYIQIKLENELIKGETKLTEQQAKAYRDWETDRKSTRLNSSHRSLSRMPSSA